MKRNFPQDPLLRTSHASCARIPLPFLKKSKSTVSVTGITKILFSMHTTSASIGIIAGKLMFAARSSSAGSSALPVRPTTRHAGILFKSAATGWAKHLMSVMAVTNHSINAPFPTSICTMHALPTANTGKPSVPPEAVSI